MAATTTIPHFRNFPQELRDQIWNDALPEKDKPALYPWKKGCWCPRRLQKSDPGWEPNEDLNLRLDFRHDLLDHVEVEIPLFFVNREARRAALAWMRKQNITLRFRKDKQCWVFTRPFDQTMDALYISMDDIGGFFIEPIDRLDEPDIFGQSVFVAPDVTRIAVPAALFQDDGDVSSLPELFEWYSVLKRLFVVVNPQLCWGDYDRPQVQGQQQWEVKQTLGRIFVYNHSNRRFDSHDGNSEAAGDETLYRQVEEACGYLGEMAARNKSDGLEIRPVFAARR